LLSPVGTTRVIQALPAELAPHVRAVALRPDTVAVVLDVGEVRLGTVSELAAKFSAAVAVMHTYNGARFDYIDVSSAPNPVSMP
jgi:hypothetical protein